MAAATAWFRRSALMYTLGAWTIFGYIVYRTSSYMTPRQAEEQPFPSEENCSDGGMGFLKSVTKHGLSETTTFRKPGSSFSVVTTVNSNPDFVPYTTRLQNYLESFFDNRGGKEE